MNISVEIAKQIREDIGATHLILFVMGPDGEQNVSTHGSHEKEAHEAASYGNRLKKLLGWPDELCQSTPAQRAEWRRKDASQISARIDALKQDVQKRRSQLDQIEWGAEGPDDRVSGRMGFIEQIEFAVEQLEWVLASDGDERS